MNRTYLPENDEENKWNNLFTCCLQPDVFFDTLETPSEDLLAGISRLTQFRNFLADVRVPGVKGAIPVFFQVETWDLQLCQAIHQVIGDACTSNWRYVMRVLRPETVFPYLILNNERRGGKTFGIAVFSAGRLLFCPPGFITRHFAGSESQAKTILVYIIWLLASRGYNIKHTSTKIECFHPGFPDNPSQIHAEAATENRRGEIADEISVDEHHLLKADILGFVLFGMTVPDPVTLTCFSTRKHSDVKGMEDYADNFTASMIPRILRYSCEGFCRWCVANVSDEDQKKCYHTSHYGGNNTKSFKEQTISEIMMSLGLSNSAYEQEVKNILTDNTARVFNKKYLEEALAEPTMPSRSKDLKILYVGFDPSGGGKDMSAGVAIGYGAVQGARFAEVRELSPPQLKNIFSLVSFFSAFFYFIFLFIVALVPLLQSGLV